MKWHQPSITSKRLRVFVSVTRTHLFYSYFLSSDKLFIATEEGHYLKAFLRYLIACIETVKSWLGLKFLYLFLVTWANLTRHCRSHNSDKAVLMSVIYQDIKLTELL